MIGHSGSARNDRQPVTGLVIHDLPGGDLILGEVFAGTTKTGHHYWNRLPDGQRRENQRVATDPDRLHRGQVPQRDQTHPTGDDAAPGPGIRVSHTNGTVP